ncbi:MAG: pentapeptide repeat-containing protein [Calothrix sp. MO_167.B12]|nr:pentapeptide repeat-containing protein [Calothrix sp. MO_167.B12]
MQLKIVASITLISVLGLVTQAWAVNEGDLQKLKETGVCPRCDLSGADMSQLNLFGANLRNANLQSAILSESNLENADFTGANLESANLNSSNLKGASFTGANLKSASLENSDLSYAGFMGANLEAANLKNSTSKLTNFRGAHFRLTVMPNGSDTSDKPYGWSLQRQSLRKCDEFKPENARGTTCYVD